MPIYFFFFNWIFFISRSKKHIFGLCLTSTPSSCLQLYSPLNWAQISHSGLVKSNSGLRKLGNGEKKSFMNAKKLQSCTVFCKILQSEDLLSIWTSRTIWTWFKHCVVSLRLSGSGPHCAQSWTGPEFAFTCVPLWPALWKTFRGESGYQYNLCLLQDSRVRNNRN